MDFNKLEACKKRFGAHAWSRRILTEIDYALQLSALGRCSEAPVARAAEVLYENLRNNGTLTERGCRAAEALLRPLAAEAKRNTALCVAHAHIDMNWLWGMDETTSITLSTVATMLELLDRYPQFRFAQSQASVYRIVERLRPDLLKRIRAHVRHGRWEVTAGSWVECDKNLPSGESLSRQIAFTRRYLSELLHLSPNAIDLDFQPDTFGHSAQVPGILAQNGIRYYYHCRGNDMPPLYRWSAEGGSVLVYREPMWYNANIGYGDFAHVPDFCARYGLDKVLKVYGVGDHGGGATVRDIERLLEMQKYPVFPDIRFGSYHEFFEHIEQKSPQMPEVRGEQNPIFPGCYTSQSLIKAGNAKSERNLLRAEFFTVLASAPRNARTLLDGAWERVLFNQFHDILPGSGREATRNHALGLYQEADAASGAVLDASLRAFAAEVSTEALFSDAPQLSDPGPDTSFGAGSGYRAGENIFAQGVGEGRERAFLLLHTGGRSRRALVPLDVWDYAGDVARLAAFDAEGNKLPCRLKRPNAETYWSHDVHTVEVEATLPPFGYTSVVLRPEAPGIPAIAYPPCFERVDASAPLVLENRYLRAEFDGTCALASLKDGNGRERLSAPARFRLVREDGAKLMSAWVVGRATSVAPLEDAKVTGYTRDALGDELCFEIPFGVSRLFVTASLPACSRVLRLSVRCDFRECGVFGETIPKLEYRLPLAAGSERAAFAIPFGILERPAQDGEVCSHGLCHAGPQDRAVTLLSDTKYGFRFDGKSISVDCLRASFDPDPLPECGMRVFELGIAPGARTNNELLEDRREFCQSPVVLPVARHAGARPAQGRLLDFESAAFLSSAERRDGKTTLCVVNADDEPRDVRFGGRKERLPAHGFRAFPLT